MNFALFDSFKNSFNSTEKNSFKNISDYSFKKIFTQKTYDYSFNKNINF